MNHREPGGSPMARMPVNRLLFHMAAPMMVSMVGQALYNVVDTFFVSHIPDSPEIVDYGEKAVNALTLAYPIQILMIAIGVGTGVGINAVLARQLGQKRREVASETAGNAIFVTLVYSLAFFLFGLFGAPAFIASQTGNEEIGSLAVLYLQIVTIFSFGTVMYMALEKIIMATGHTMVTMTAQLAGALANCLLDPILIYGCFGLPAMGVAGAAAATVIGQFLSLFIAGHYYFHEIRELDHGFRCLKPRLQVLSPVYAIGIPAMVMQLLTPVMSYGMNIILGGLSVSAVTAYGIYYKLQNFVFMPAYGLNNASIPIISFNRGAGRGDRVKGTLRWALMGALAIMAAGMAVIGAGAGILVHGFGLTEESMNLTVTALHIILWGFPFAGITIILQGACQAMEEGGCSLLISFVRLILIPLPFAWLAAKESNGLFLVWLSIPGGELAAGILALFLTVWAMKKRDIR
ncbi:MATE family efflux transporter [uncultured Dialister sp.]|uniref:MATE family efflux transporter n=1 Tax=uncultured Dialister sp. TaxID=278064 RepID=UPI0025D9E296|nr:MATE family efflux transporter [uncultured Dialister sp.]